MFDRKISFFCLIVFECDLIQVNINLSHSNAFYDSANIDTFIITTANFFEMISEVKK